jgi:hypothetical protein
MMMKSATIAQNASQSEVIDLQDSEAVGLIMPGAWTAAAITFLAAEKPDGTFLPIYDDGKLEVTLAADKLAVSTAIALDTISAKLRPFRYIKLRSGVAATPVNQEAARTIHVIGK